MSRVLLEELTGFAANQEIPRILWNPKVHYRTHKRQPCFRVLPCFIFHLSSITVYIDVCRKEHVVNLSSDKCFGLVDTEQRGLEENTNGKQIVESLEVCLVYYQSDSFLWSRYTKSLIYLSKFSFQSVQFPPLVNQISTFFETKELLPCSQESAADLETDKSHL